MPRWERGHPARHSNCARKKTYPFKPLSIRHPETPKLTTHPTIFPHFRQNRPRFRSNLLQPMRYCGLRDPQRLRYLHLRFPLLQTHHDHPLHLV